MSETVLVTKPEFRKGESEFSACKLFQFRPAPEDEQALAAEVKQQGCRAVIVGVQAYSGPLYEALANASGGAAALICRFGQGHDSIDKDLAAACNVLVANTPGVLAGSVAELTIWLMGCLARRIVPVHNGMMHGDFTPMRGINLSGRTLGILGFGQIAKMVALIASYGFGMQVIAGGRASIEEFLEREQVPWEGVERLYGIDSYTGDLEQVLASAEIVSLHMPVNNGTRDYINPHRLSLMRPNTLLINTARGALVDEGALYDALECGQINGAALDVYQHEPYVPVSPDKDLRTLNNVILTPHIGSNTVDSNRNMAERAIQNVQHFFAGDIEAMDLVAAPERS